jgi:hypothetical protein
MTENHSKNTDEMISEMEADEQLWTEREIPETYRRQAETDHDLVPIVVIIAATLLTLGCILSCAAILIVFILNAPW